MDVSVTAGPFLGLPAKQLQGLQACEVQANRCLQIKVQIINMVLFSLSKARVHLVFSLAPSFVYVLILTF